MATCDELAPFVLPEVEGLESGAKKGGGSYGSIYDVTVNSTPYIAKRLHDILVDYNYVNPRDREAALEMFRQECVLLSKLEHPNVVRFIGVHYGRNPDDLSLIMEKLHTDLDKYLETHPNIPLPVKLSILRDVSCGLLYLHEHSPPIIHRDLTARNVLLTHDHDMRAKIADLGVSKIFDLRAQVATTQTKAPGMVYYMPPEALTDKPQYDVSLDIFSFGHLTLHTVTQTSPQTDDNKITESAVRRGERQLAKREAAINQIGRDHCLYPIIAKCLQDMPKRRPTTRELNGMIEAIISSMLVNVLVLGRTGVGKSALINSLAGCNAAEEIATECESWKPADVQSHDVESKGINMTLWDTPGYLEDGLEKGDAEQTLREIEAKCNPTKMDLVLFCVNFSNKRIAKEDVSTITAYTEKFGVEMWDHAVIAFANANEVQPPPDSPEASCDFFKRKLENWTEGFREILQTKTKVPEEKIKTIPMIPTGYRECSLPDRRDWITKLWERSYKQVKLSAQPAFRKSDRLSLKEDTTREMESQTVEKRHLDFSKATHSSRCSLQ